MSPSSLHHSGSDTPLHALNVDFDDLAKHDPSWEAIVKQAKEVKWLDFQDPTVVRQLTKSVLKHNFKLDLELPDDRLCPPVPVRWNYIRWIQDLLDTTSDTYTEHHDPDRDVLGMDIGTGASAIYALLGCSTRSSWRMAGTDVDQHSLDYARKNVNANALNDRIKLALSNTDAPLVPIDKLRIEELDFVMANPPFYSSKEDMQAAYRGKKEPTSAANFASENESICPGGDIGFVTRIFEESLVLKERVQWYTAMLAKLASLHQIVAKLKEHNVNNFAVTNLQAGHRTRRWAIAWSFKDLRPRNDIARHGELVHAVLPCPTAQTIAVPAMSTQLAADRVNSTLKSLDVRWQWKPLIATGVMETTGNVWSRAARRRKKFGNATNQSKAESEGAEILTSADNENDEEYPIALAVKITCKAEEVDVRWLRGSDYLLFESFCGVLKSSLRTPEP